MNHSISTYLTDYCINAKWISEGKREWCVYAIEKRLDSIATFGLLFVVAFCCRCLPKALYFTIAFYMLRRRIGGWHAPTAWLCSILSITLVMVVIFLVLPLFQNLDFSVVLIINSASLLWGFLLEPVYPPQLHFSKKEITENYRKKNLLLAIFFIVEIILILLHLHEFFELTLLSVLTGVFSVNIEKINHFIHERNGINENK